MHEVLHVLEVHPRIDGWLTHRSLVRRSCDGTHSRHELGRVANGGVLVGDLRTIMGAHRIDHRRHDRHRMAVGREGVEVQIHVAMQCRVARQQLGEGIALRRGRQPTGDEQHGRLHERHLVLGQGLDRDATVEQTTVLAVDPRDCRPARRRVRQGRVQGRHAGEFAQS